MYLPPDTRPHFAIEAVMLPSILMKYNDAAITFFSTSIPIYFWQDGETGKIAPSLALPTPSYLPSLIPILVASGEQITFSAKMENQKYNGKDSVVYYDLFATPGVVCTPGWVSLSFTNTQASCVGLKFQLNFTSNVIWIGPDNQFS
jgi:hypothetical protein